MRLTGAGVDRVVAHALEDNTGLADGVNNGRKSGLGENDIGGTTGSVGGSLDGDSDVGAGKGGGIVGSISSHGDEVTEGLEALDNLVLVLGEDTGESIRVHDHLVESAVLAVGGESSSLHNLSGVHVVSQAETTSGLLGNGELVTGNHLDANTESLSVVDGLLGVITGRVEDGEESDELESVSGLVDLAGGNVLVGDGEGTESTGGELLDVLLELVLNLGGLVAGAEVDDDTLENEKAKSGTALSSRSLARGYSRSFPW